jgi:hypothetical protein
MDSKNINKFLDVMLKNKFKNIVKNVKVTEEILDIKDNLKFTKVFIGLSRYDDIYYDDKIKEYINEIMRYMSPGNKIINQIVFYIDE